MIATGRYGGTRTTRQELRWHLDTRPTAVRRLRQELSAALDVRAVPEPGREAVLLVANELAVNAVEHGADPVKVLAEFTPDSVHIAVSDGSAAAPQLRPMDISAVRGRGLQMVADFSTRWSWHRDAAGKTVWADVPLDGT